MLGFSRGNKSGESVATKCAAKTVSNHHTCQASEWHKLVDICQSTEEFIKHGNQDCVFNSSPGKGFPARCFVRRVSRQVLLCPGDLAETCEEHTYISQIYAWLMSATQVVLQSFAITWVSVVLPAFTPNSATARASAIPTLVIRLDVQDASRSSLSPTSGEDTMRNAEQERRRSCSRQIEAMS